MRASQADTVPTTDSQQPLQSPAQQLQSGKFYYKDGSTYEGQYKVLGLAAASATEAAPAKKPAKKPAKEDDLPAQPAEPPKPVRHGIGKLACGSYSYMGDWMDDEMHGQGKFVFASGASYHGCFDRNKFHGQGTYVFPDGKQYQGQWVANVMHGEGCFTDTEGHQWTGQFFNGAGPGLTCQL